MSAPAEAGRTHSHHYGAIGDLVRHACTARNHWQDRNRASEGKAGAVDSWAGGNFDSACKLALEGWREGRARMVEVMGRVTNNQTASRPMRRMDVAGAYPDVGLAVAGEPACMVDLGYEIAAARPIVRMLVSASVASNITPEEIMLRGGAILAFVDQLEQAGLSCEVDILCQSTSSGGHYVYGRFTAKRAGEPLEIDRMAYALVHPTMLRRLGFRLMETLDWTEPHFVGGYGMPCDPSESEIDGAVYFPSMDYSWSGRISTPKAAAEYVRSVIKDSPYGYVLGSTGTE